MIQRNHTQSTSLNEGAQINMTFEESEPTDLIRLEIIKEEPINPLDDRESQEQS